MRVVAHMVTPPVLSGRWPILLDGIVAYQWARAHCPRFGIRGDIDPEETDGFPLPLDRLEAGGDWVWAASAATPVHPGSPAAEWVHSRNDELRYDRRVPAPLDNVDPAKPQWKPSRIPHAVTPCTALEWRAATGDPEILIRLLDSVANVGRLHHRGAGQVASWEIHDAGTVELGPADRPIPQPGSGFKQGIRPPYWHPVQHREVAPWTG